MSDDLDRPPLKPFYDPGPAKRKRRTAITNMRQEYYERKKRELAEQLAKPVRERIGGLRTMRSGDFSEEELRAIKERSRGR